MYIYKIYMDIFNKCAQFDVCVCEHTHTLILYGSEHHGWKHQKLNLTHIKVTHYKAAHQILEKPRKKEEKHERHIIGKKTDYYKPTSPSYVLQKKLKYTFMLSRDIISSSTHGIHQI